MRGEFWYTCPPCPDDNFGSSDDETLVHVASSTASYTTSTGADCASVGLIPDTFVFAPARRILCLLTTTASL